MSVGLKGNADGSGAIQVGGTDAVTLSTALDTTLAGSLNAPNTFGFKNRIINGDMRIDQRNAGASVTPTNGQYLVDRWAAALTQASKFTAQQNAASVTPPVGFTNYLGMTSSSAYSVVSSDVFFVKQAIEGLNVSDLAWGTANAATVTLSFWVRSSLTGTFGGSLNNSAQNRSYPFTFTINAANTWEKETITIAGDTSGTWLTTNGVGIYLNLSLGVGSTGSGTAGAWAGSAFYSATGATSVVGTNGATFYVTGVQLEKGRLATSFDVRDYGTELSMCKRYYHRLTAGAIGTRFGLGQAITTTTMLANTQFPVTMRAAPTALEQNGTAANYLVSIAAGTNSAGSAVPTFNSADTFEANTIFTIASGLVAGNASYYSASAVGVYLGWSAEL